MVHNQQIVLVVILLIFLTHKILHVQIVQKDIIQINK